MGGNLTFYILSAVILIFSILAVSSRKLLRAAIYLLFVLVGVAVFYLMVDYLFLAAVQVVVYMGGILVVIIFSILLTSHLAERLPRVPGWVMVITFFTTVIGAGIVLSVLYNQELVASQGQAIDNNVSTIGYSLLSYERLGYVLPFEVISILLLAALIGAIVIARRQPNVKNP